MTFNAMSKALRAARMQRSVFAALLMLALAANVMLAVTLSSTARTTVLVPTHIRDGMVAAGAVDRRFVEALAKDALAAFYNTSPQTTEYGRTVVERIASVRDRPELLKAYDGIAIDIKARDITTVFFLQRINHSSDALKLSVEGSFATFIGKTLVTREPRTVEVHFIEEANSVRLSRLVALDIDEDKS